MMSISVSQNPDGEERRYSSDPLFLSGHMAGSLSGILGCLQEARLLSRPNFVSDQPTQQKRAYAHR